VPGEDGGFNTVYPPELRQDFTKRYCGRAGRLVDWKPILLQPDQTLISFNGVYNQTDLEWSLFYSMTYVYTPVEQTVTVMHGSDDDGKLWINDQPIFSVYAQRSPLFYDKAQITLQQGWNKVVSKVCERRGGTSMNMTFVTEDGKEVSGLIYNAYQQK
jgi:hypothetical protein